eukprot:432427-Rhodomonas_salina.4
MPQRTFGVHGSCCFCLSPRNQGEDVTISPVSESVIFHNDDTYRTVCSAICPGWTAHAHGKHSWNNNERTVEAHAMYMDPLFARTTWKLTFCSSYGDRTLGEASHTPGWDIRRSHLAQRAPPNLANGVTFAQSVDCGWLSGPTGRTYRRIRSQLHCRVGNPKQSMLILHAPPRN